jgi:hypothetical protein
VVILWTCPALVAGENNLTMIPAIVTNRIPLDFSIKIANIFTQALHSPKPAQFITKLGLGRLNEEIKKGVGRK